MSWREELRDASFRGVPFKVESHDAEGIGRRTVVHTFPLRDEPQPEDLGAENQSFSIEAYVIGDDYMSTRDALLRALREPGPGPLVHPYLGELQVSVLPGGRLRESSREGGMARFTIKFVRASEKQYPGVEQATPEALTASAGTTTEAAKQSFADRFSVLKMPQFVSDEAKAQIESALKEIDEVARTISRLPEGAADLVALIDDVSVSVTTLMQTPLDLAQSLQEMVSQIRTAASRPEAAIEALRIMFDFGDDLPAVPLTTPARQAQADNQAAVTTLLQQLATIEVARASADLDFSSYDDAAAFRDEMIEQFDKLVENVVDDELYQELVAARAALIADLNARGADLARIVTITLPESLPALVLAYSLYGDATRDAEIIARNKVGNPLFLPSGVPLEVLSDV